MNRRREKKEGDQRDEHKMKKDIGKAGKDDAHKKQNRVQRERRPKLQTGQGEGLLRWVTGLLLVNKITMGA